MTRSSGAVEVIDDGSLNGTFLNGERIRRALLRHGDVISVGRRRLRFVQIGPRRHDLDHPTQPLELAAAPAAA
jgi:pSer/pThr/pTyr-binding forkhead associated (FHA) protein